jgi:L-2,4-diaminobutyrate decarboxylase
MSIDAKDRMFDVPKEGGAVARTLGQVWEQLANPRNPFCPLSEGLDFTLEREQGVKLTDVLTDVLNSVVKHGVNFRHPWVFAHMVPPPSTVSVIADLIIGAMNQCAFIWEEAPMAAEMEREVIRWMNNRLKYGKRAGGILTSGGTMSNCLVTYLALERARQRGRFRPGRHYILVTDQAHFSVEKAARLVGLGTHAIIRVPSNSTGRIDAGRIATTVHQEFRRSRVPFLVICTAGTTNTGSLEPVEEFLSLARRFDAWCHVDAAHGGFMSLCESQELQISKWNLADSISWDAHKSLYVSYAAGALLVREDSLLDPLTFHSEYALKTGSNGDAGARHIEGSRRFEALKLWMTIKHFGVAGFRDATAKVLALAQKWASRVRASDDFRLVADPDTNIVCFRLAYVDLEGECLNQVTESIQKYLFANGGPLLSSTKICGESVLRAVFLNPETEERELDAAFDRMSEQAKLQIERNIRVPEGRHENTFCYEPSP